MITAPPAGSVEPTLGNLSPKAAAALLRDHLHPTDVREFIRSSPAHLIALCAVLIIACLTSGAVTAAMVSDRQQALNGLLDQTEPFANSAQRLYSSLSIADAAAATAFISGGVEPQAVRDRYTQAIGEASAELAGGAAGTEDADAPARRLLSGVATQLPVYTGLVETARTNNRIGNPVGAAYLAEASNLMQTRMLPMAEALSKQQSAAVVKIQQQYVHAPWWAMSLVTLALILLILGQLYLARRWRRRINPGLVVATLAMAVLFAWIVASGWLSASATDRALDRGTKPLDQLTAGRIVAQQARSDETLKLVRRDTTGVYDTAFDADIQRLGSILTELGTSNGNVVDADSARDLWDQSHKRMNATLAAGDYDGASKVAIGPGAMDSMVQYSRLDDAMEVGIAQTRSSVRADVSHASKVLDVLSPGSLLLVAAAAVLVGVGLWPRLREYR
ncbi:hypothetical protein [Antrihabitans cavernicola]|uniref:Secreted protein n=1 Tax=Antrihabitans cavernicola TaxID=2495913 RepID=A0A5A7S9F7_9NOCA|nr:hypothetical protein [Spelaeibacter cavernicola]KAA0022114.1 hypothetical protein FOY51_13995 [Spelaeibacter cavernicola]